MTTPHLLGLEHHLLRSRTPSRDGLIDLCCDCHARTDAPFRQGRLVITALGDAAAPGAMDGSQVA